MPTLITASTLNIRHSLCLLLFVAAAFARPVLMTAQHTQASKLLLGAATHRGLSTKRQWHHRCPCRVRRTAKPDGTDGSLPLSLRVLLPFPRTPFDPAHARPRSSFCARPRDSQRCRVPRIHPGYHMHDAMYTSSECSELGTCCCTQACLLTCTRV